MPSKETLRLHYRYLRDSISEPERKRWDKIIVQHFIESEAYDKANRIFTYVSNGSEVDTLGIIEQAWIDSKEVLVPRTTKERGIMEAVQITGMEQLIPGKFAILEPDSILPASDFEVIELVLVPGIAFDHRGYRIGYGGGYYDRLMPHLGNHVPKIGLAYSPQLSPDPIPTNSFDQPVDSIITENGWLAAER